MDDEDNLNISEWKTLLLEDFHRPVRPFPPKLLFPEVPGEDLGIDGIVSNFLFFRNWWWVALPISVLYIVGIFWLEHHMKFRPAYSLRGPLIVWNGLLAVFSIWGALRLVPALLYDLTQNLGCEGCGIGASWMYFFVWSKLFELGDTLFIVLRKRPLIFLHWYHHITVLLYTWYGTDGGTACGAYFCATNVFIHSLMYSYYAARSLGAHIPRVMQMSLTALQILQMIIGITVSAISYHYKTRYGSGCAASVEIILVSIAMLVSYAVLFSLFFYKTYIRGVKSSDALSPLALLMGVKGVIGGMFAFVGEFNDSFTGDLEDDEEEEKRLLHEHTD
ncbi:unnamed protein product [Cyprideis torosa]|uniref:Elongation of very long chain fatty acids protein n=1 Tax=Cyprideis torosa TaxID=163714 RepID=A0A7R8ZLP7_9CRUS|nr:unnamed protein product [Cyprideis torosa]CAG0893746.1 unnamed protein product [Cyprideis torosa]